MGQMPLLLLLVLAWPLGRPRCLSPLVLLLALAGGPVRSRATARTGPLDVTEEGPNLLEDEFVHLDYYFALLRRDMHRQGKGQLWLAFEHGVPKVRLRGLATSPRFGDGEIILVIDAKRQQMYATFRLSTLHDGQCLIYNFPKPQDNPGLMRRLRWRKEQVSRWQKAEAQRWRDADAPHKPLDGTASGDAATAAGLLSVNWTKSYKLEFLLGHGGMELKGVDIRDTGGRVVKNVRLDDPLQSGRRAPDGPQDGADEGIFAVAPTCVPASETKDPTAKVELIPPFKRSSALNDLLLVLADHAQGGEWSRLFMVLSIITVPGDVAVMIEDPNPPRLDRLHGISFDYKATVYRLGMGKSLEFNDPAADMDKEDDTHTSDGSIWLDLEARKFRLSGESDGTKVGPLLMDLVAHGSSAKVFANVNLTAQLEHQCLAYDYPKPLEGEVGKLSSVADRGLHFFSVAEVDGEDCGIFVAPLAHGRWIHVYVDMESDRQNVILRSEVHKGGKLLRTIDVIRWHVGDAAAAREVEPGTAWGCSEEPSHGPQLAHLGLRRAEHWSMELQDALHALRHMDPSFAVLEVMALAGDVAIMVREPEAPELWKLPEASFTYYLHAGSTPGSSKPLNAHGRFAANFGAGQLRATVDTLDSGGANLSLALTEGLVAVRVEESGKGPECLTLPLEDSSACTSASENLPCGLSDAGRCGAIAQKTFACKDAQCHSTCTTLFGREDSIGCKDPAARGPSRPCTASAADCRSCHYACVASCRTVGVEAAPCVALLYQNADFSGWSATFLEGSHDASTFPAHGAGDLSSSVTGALAVTGAGCVATLFTQQGFRGASASFQEGSYEDDSLFAQGLRKGVRGIVVRRVDLSLSHDSVSLQFEQRTLVEGVSGWVGEHYNYSEVPKQLVGAVLFAGPFNKVPKGELSLRSPRRGSAFFWHDAERSPGPTVLGWEDAGKMFYDAGELRRQLQVFRKTVEVATTLVIPVPEDWIGGVAFKEEPSVAALALGSRRPLGSLFNTSSSSAAPMHGPGVFDGIELVEDEECNRFTYAGFPAIRLWFSVENEAVCRFQIFGPGMESNSHRGAVIDVPGWTPDYFPGNAPRGGAPLASAPSGWHCSPAAGSKSPWLWLDVEPREVDAVPGAAVPAAFALAKLAQATGAVGLLPPHALHTLSRMAMVLPSESAAVAAAAAASVAGMVPGSSPPPPKPPTPAPAPMVDIFGPELRTFSFIFSSTSTDSVGRLRHGKGELKVDLVRRQLYLRSEGQISSGIHRAESRIVFQGDKGKLHAETKISSEDSDEPFVQCWSVDAMSALAGLDGSSAQPNPFMEAKAAGQFSDRLSIHLGVGRRLDIVPSKDGKVLRSMTMHDVPRGAVTTIEAEAWNTEEIDPGWFQRGWDCEDTNLISRSESVAVWDLIRIFFPPQLSYGSLTVAEAAAAAAGNR